eukprot:4349812-Pyramimonas_sp.AAC.1
MCRNYNFDAHNMHVLGHSCWSTLFASWGFPGMRTQEVMVSRSPYTQQPVCFNAMSADNFCNNGLLYDVCLHTGACQENRHRRAGH